MTNIQTTEMAEAKVKSVYCFAIAPSMKRKGIAVKLLERVCKDASADGFDFVEAYPNKKIINMFRDFMGPYDLYKKFDFIIHEEKDDVFVVRKYLE